MERADLIVVGAGPAGAAAALAALRRWPAAKVLLLDKSAFPRDKTCGDGISPDGVAELDRLGARSVLDGYTPVTRLRVRSAGGRETRGMAALPGYVVPRRVLDARLVALACSAGARLVRVAVHTLEQDRHRVRIEGRFEAPVVIAADGANSAMRRRLGLPATADRHLGIAVRGYAPSAAGPPELYLGWVPANPPAYVWSFPVDEGARNVGFAVLARRSWRLTRAGLEAELRRHLPDAAPDPATVKAHHLPMASGRPWPYRGRVLLAGDAASLVNPLSGEGISHALASGRLAAEAVLDAPAYPGPRYAARLRHELGRHFRDTALLALGVAWPFTTDLVITAARDPTVLNAVTALATGRGVLSPWLLARFATAPLTPAVERQTMPAGAARV